MEVPNWESEQDGQVLIQTIVSLTGLPEPLAQQEMDHILQQSGQDSSKITLSELRQAMLEYLDALQADFLKEESQE